jgi:hypothetical protein
MTNASLSEIRADEPITPRSLGAVAAAVATCTHPEASRSPTGAPDDGATWCSACGALHREGNPEGAWQLPALTSRLTRRRFEELVLLLHSVVQLTQLARAHVAPQASASTAHIVLRSVRTSLAELSRLPVVRDLGALEHAIAAMPPSIGRP